MKLENQEKLVKEFNFYKLGDSPQYPFFWGFECKDGWFNLIWDLSCELQKIKFKGKVTQVKEKFGGLRLYVDYSTEEEDKIITEAEELSYKICETCGKKGKLRDYGWLSVLCISCYLRLLIKRRYFKFII